MPAGGPGVADAAAERLSQRNVHYSNLNGVASALAVNMVHPFIGIYALRLGATTAQLGLLSSMPALFSLACVIPGGRLLARARSRQRVTFLLVAASRAFFLAYALAPLFERPAGAWFLVFAFGMTSLPATLAAVSFQSLVADVLTPRSRARALAYRAGLGSLTGIVPLLGIGLLLDRLPYPGGYQLVFAAAFAVGLAEGLLLLRLREAPVAPGGARGDGPRSPAGEASRIPSGETAAGRSHDPSLREILRHREFPAFATAAFVLHLGWSMGGPLFTKYRVQVMGADNAWISAFAAAESLAAVATAVYWARLGEHRGHRRVLWWAAAGVAGNVWLLAAVTALPLGTIPAVWAGVFNTGTNLMLFNSLLEMIPSGRRTGYLAYYAAAVNTAALVGPMLGVLLVDVAGIQPALCITGLVRAGGGLLFYAGLRRGCPVRVIRPVLGAVR